MQSEADLELQAISKMTSDSSDPRDAADFGSLGIPQFFSSEQEEFVKQ